MKHLSARVLVAAAVSAVIAIAALPGSAVSSTRDVSTKKCGSGGVRAVIDGQPACLWVGEHCRRRFDAQYRRYGFACPKWGLTIVSRWRARDLGALPGFPVSGATGINERGDVVGVSTNEGVTPDYSKKTDRVFLWRDGHMQDISPPIAWTFHADFTAINDAGQVVETLHSRSSGEARSFEWENGVSRDLGTLGGTRTGATVNARGQIVGWSETTSATHAFLWEGGTMRDLGTLGGGASAATSINARGQIVGWASTATGDVHAFLWEDGAMRDLGILGNGIFSFRFLAINDHGLVVGNSSDSDGHNAHVVTWMDGTLADIDVGGFASYAYLLNNRGQVLLVRYIVGNPSYVLLWQDGSYRDLGRWLPEALNDRGQMIANLKGRPNGALPQAFIWEKGRAWNLGNLGARDASATALNERDQIVGGPAHAPRRGYHAVIWTRRKTSP